MSAEEIIILFENEKIRIEKIMSFGAITSKENWYDSEWDEWVCVTRGKAVLEFVDFKLTLMSGEGFYISSHLKHRVDYTSEDCEWLCVYLKL